MAQFDPSRMAELSDEDLIERITDAAKYMPEVVDFARDELIRRGARIPTAEICGHCGKQYWSTPALSSGMCGKCHQEKRLGEEQEKRRQLREAHENKEKEWKAAVRNEQVIVCHV
jgi:hypothetical protein